MTATHPAPGECGARRGGIAESEVRVVLPVIVFNTAFVLAGFRAPLSRVPQGGCTEASSGRTVQQSDLEAEGFTLREGQLGTLESILPYR